MRALKETLMERDNISAAEADAQIDEARHLLNVYLAEGMETEAYYICEECFVLEPDYLMDLVD